MGNKAKSVAKKELKARNHSHVWDISSKFLPKNTKAKSYVDEVIRTASDLNYINKKVQYASLISSYNIGLINKPGGWNQSKREVFDNVREFVYHYENFCQKAYMHREKLLQFINAVLPIGYTDKQVRILHILINPDVKATGINKLLSKFSDNKTSLGKVIKDRTKLTHQLLYEAEFDHYFRPISKFNSREEFKSWCQTWKKQILSHAKITENCIRLISKVDNEIAARVIKFKTKVK